MQLSLLSCSEALGLVLSKWRSEMSAHVAIQVGDAAGEHQKKFVPRTNNDKEEYEAWLQRQQVKLRNFGGGRGAIHKEFADI